MKGRSLTHPLNSEEAQQKKQMQLKMPLCGIKRVIANSSMMECNLLSNNDTFWNQTINARLHAAYMTGVGMQTFLFFI